MLTLKRKSHQEGRGPRSKIRTKEDSGKDREKPGLKQEVIAGEGLE